MYFPHTQYPTRAMNVVLRSDADPDPRHGRARQTLRANRSRSADVSRADDGGAGGESLARRRFSMLLFALFAALRSCLAMVGVYGVLAYLVDQGDAEIGIRMALGATPAGVLRLIVGHGAIVATAGVAIGLAGAFFLSRTFEGLLFGIGAADPVTFVASPALLVAVAIAASYVPARRAARIDPIACLRSE